MRRTIALLALALFAAACPRGAVRQAPSPGATRRPPSIEVLAQNFLLPAGRENAVRFGLESAEPGVRIIVTFPDTGSIVAACGLTSIDDVAPEPAGNACRSEIPSGVREELVREGGLGGIALWVRTGSAVTANLRLEYAERGRRVRIKLPLLRAPAAPSACADNACNPYFEVRPVRGGAFTASATWSGGEARLALLEGRVIAKSFTATGVPYIIAARDEGEAPASIQTRMSAPAEYALVLDQNKTDLQRIDIDASWA